MDRLIEFNNGLRMCLKKNITAYSVNVLFSVECGAFYPCDEKIGIAHMLEHNVLSDTGNSLNNVLEKIGTFVEAYTYDFNTEFSIRTFKEHLPLCIKLLYNRIFYAQFDKIFFEKEKTVIYEEYLKQRNNVMPANAFVASEIFYSNTFIENSGYGIGNKQQLKEITYNEMLNYYNKYYIPSRTTIVIAGNFEEKQIISILSHLIKNDKAQTKHKIFIEQDIGFNNKNQLEIIVNKMKLGSSCVEIVCNACNALDRNKWTYECLALMLGGLSATVSLLKNRLRNQLGYIYNCDVSLDSSICYKNCGTLNIRYYVDNKFVENSVFECFKIIRQLLKTNCENILEYAKISLINNLKIKLENIEKVCSINAQNLMLFGSMFEIEKEIGYISKISKLDIKKCIEYIFAHKKVISIMGKKINTKKMYNKLMGII